MAKKKRKDWEVNQGLISNAVFVLIKKKMKMPSYQDIAEHTGLAKRTVQRHMEEVSFDDFTQKFRANSEMVLLKLFQRAMEGKSPRFMELWFKVVEGVDSKKHIDVTTMGESITPTQKATIKLSNGTEIEL